MPTKAELEQENELLRIGGQAMNNRFLDWCWKEGPQPWWKFWHPMSGFSGGVLVFLLCFGLFLALRWLLL